MHPFPILFPSIFESLFNLKTEKMKNFMSAVMVLCFVVLGFNADAKTTPLFSQINLVSDTTALVEYKGKYSFANDAPVSEVVVIIDKDGLMAKSDQGNFALKPVENKADNFTIEEISAEVIFTRDDKKKIVGIQVKMTDGTIEGKKE
jgi:tRNA-binding EMAP/Myf-like protein